VETYQEDLFEGPYKSFYPNGQLKLACVYKNNNIEGKWLQYYESGQLKEEVLFEGNTENGPFKEYHPNGQLSVEGSYKEGDNEHGPLKFYDEQGQHYKTMECDMGICRTVWSQENYKGSKAKSKKSKG
jgi:antitoxin component YwqK of YwqJK toxin-antitoxin module